MWSIKHYPHLNLLGVDIPSTTGVSYIHEETRPIIQRYRHSAYCR